MNTLIGMTQDRLMELVFGVPIFTVCLFMYIMDLKKGNQ